MEDKDYNLIEDYFNGGLDDASKAEVELRVQKDKAFAEAFAAHRDLLEVVDLKTESDLRELLANEEAKLKEKAENPDKPAISIRRWLSAAAALVVFVVVAGWLLIRGDQSVNEQKLFAENFTAYTNIIAPNRRGENDESKLNLAFLAYDNKQYQKAIADFQSLKADTLQNELTFYIGVSYLAIDEAERAILTLQDVSDNSQFAMEKQWYMALAHLKRNERTLTIVALKSALKLSTDPVLVRKATALLNELK